MALKKRLSRRRLQVVCGGVDSTTRTDSRPIFLMKTIKLTKDLWKDALSLTERILRSGGVVVGPTDTVYGIFCDATNEKAIKKIFELKRRPEEKALPIFVKDIATARQYAYISDAKAKFLEKVWFTPLDKERSENLTGPLPITVVFRHKEKLPKILTGGLDTIGTRIPNHPFLLELLSRLDFPLAQTSANVSGGPPIRTIHELRESNLMRRCLIRLGLVVDGGEIAGQASTMIDFTGNEPLILRSGLVTKQELDRLLQ